MTKLVSIIIPCFNAEKWLREAIDSALAQTYPHIEIIAIDDGSRDRSLAILQSYGDEIIWRGGANKGANTARNWGFSLASGDYIQYLDADDYLLPDKIAKQAGILQATGADFVYSDWRYQHHLDNGESYLDNVRVCGDKEDFLYSLLANDRWSNLAPILFSRQIVEEVTWDESLPAAQDRDFLFSVMLAGAKPIYQPGCAAIYRMYPGETVSTASKLRWLQAHCLVMEKVAKRLEEMGLLSATYRQALAVSYWEMGKEYIYSDRTNFPEFTPDYSYYRAILDKVYELDPDLFLRNKSPLYKTVHKLLNYQITERISYLYYSRIKTPTLHRQ